MRKKIIYQLEKDIASFLLDKLEHFNLTFERAARIAKFVLYHLPENLNDEQVLQILPSLDNEFTELAGIVYKNMLDYEEKHKDKVIEKVEDLIKNRHFVEANMLSSDYFKKKFKPSDY